MEFEVTMMPVLTDCSRQRLRGLHMNLLKYGSNMNERITTKEVTAAFEVTTVITMCTAFLGGNCHHYVYSP